MSAFERITKYRTNDMREFDTADDAAYHATRLEMLALLKGALGKCGDLTMRTEEFVSFVEKFAFVQLRQENPGVLAAKDALRVEAIAKRIRDFCAMDIEPRPFDTAYEDSADRAARAIAEEFLP